MYLVSFRQSKNTLKLKISEDLLFINNSVMTTSENVFINSINLDDNDIEVLDVSQSISNILKSVLVFFLTKMNPKLIRYVFLLILLVNCNNLYNSLKTEYVKNEIDENSEISFKE